MGGGVGGGSMTRGTPGAGPPPPFTGLEVATTAADALTATIRVTGVLSPRTCPMLLSVLGTHIRSGRRHLRVDVGGARITDESVRRMLAATRATLANIGGAFELLGTDSRSADIRDRRVSPG
jgi:anti-anti-sigma regulatory factor